jgi:membrane protein implicated in regulation of membrane protease activity
MDDEHATFWALVAVNIIGLVVLTFVSPAAGMAFYCVFAVLAAWWHSRTFRYRAPRRSRR